MRQGANKRSRGRNGRNKPHMPLRMQTFDSSGPDVRIRGSAWQVHERYLNLARDAAAAGDRVAAENFFQHADHYYRLINLNGEGRPQHGPHPQHQGQGQGQQPQPPGGPQPQVANGSVNGPQYGQGANGADEQPGHDTDPNDRPPHSIGD
jgi:hypothetical protein